MLQNQHLRISFALLSDDEGRLDCVCAHVFTLQWGTFHISHIAKTEDCNQKLPISCYICIQFIKLCGKGADT